MFSSLTWLLKNVSSTSTLFLLVRYSTSWSSLMIRRYVCIMTLLESLPTQWWNLTEDICQHNITWGSLVTCTLWLSLWIECGSGGAVLILRGTGPCCFCFLGSTVTLILLVQLSFWGEDPLMTLEFHVVLRHCEDSNCFFMQWDLTLPWGKYLQTWYHNDILAWCCSFLSWNYPKFVKEKITKFSCDPILGLLWPLAL